MLYRHVWHHRPRCQVECGLPTSCAHRIRLPFSGTQAMTALVKKPELFNVVPLSGEGGVSTAAGTEAYELYMMLEIAEDLVANRRASTRTSGDGDASDTKSRKKDTEGAAPLPEWATVSDDEEGRLLLGHLKPKRDTGISCGLKRCSVSYSHPSMISLHACCNWNARMPEVWGTNSRQSPAVHVPRAAWAAECKESCPCWQRVQGWKLIPSIDLW